MNTIPRVSEKHYAILIAIGVTAYITADVLHEAIGHGSLCLLQGGRITLITSVYFRAAVHSFLTDFGGPLMNLVSGLLFCLILVRTKIANGYVQLLLLVTAAFNLFWFSWLCFYSSITFKGDFSFVFNTDSGILIRRIGLIAFSLGTYWLFIKLLARIGCKFMHKLNGLPYPFPITYLAACIAALVAVSFYSPMSGDTYMEAIHFPMFLPLLLLPRLSRVQNSDSPQELTVAPNLVKWSKNFVLFATLLFIIFCLLMGRGIRP